MPENMTIMSASKLASQLSQGSKDDSFSFFPGDQFLLRRLGVGPRSERCPSCNSIIYSRRHGRCGVCERTLPESFLFTSTEVEKVDSLLKTERERHRAWLMRFEASPH
jgi:hypothetical protein